MEMKEQIKELCRQKNAIILAHNYQAVEIQKLADYTGDSLQLSLLASQTEAGIIVFCGVRFMAETAAILNPRAKVLLPVEDAGCPMADMISAEQLRKFKAHYPGSVVVCYVNSSVEVKAESDICCTSSNAVKVLQSIPEDQTILFVPDQNLGSWAARQSGRKVIPWVGYCPVHHWGFERRVLNKLRQKYPDFTFIAHPECDEDILEVADEVMSTSGMMRYVQSHDKVIIATDSGMTDYLKYLYPDKHLVSLNPKAKCQNMAKTTLQDVLQALQLERYQITVPEAIAVQALSSLQRMLELSV